MSTITVTNDTDTAVAGETDLRQAIAQAQSGDTIVFPYDRAENEEPTITLNAPLEFAAGKTVTVDLQDGFHYGFGAGEASGDTGVTISGTVVVDAGANVTIENGSIFGSIGGTNAPTAANGAGGVQGQNSDVDGGTGGNGTGGGNGEAGSAGGSALGIVQNHGALTLNNVEVLGTGYARQGAAGGTGGDGADGGSGGPNVDAAGGGGGNAGSGGPGGDGGRGGDAVGGIDNESGGVLTLKDSLIYGSAYAGSGGNGGAGGSGGSGGAGGDVFNSANGDGVGGMGGKGGGGGASGVSGDGGDATGAILNNGTIDVTGATLVQGSANAGQGGVSPGPSMAGMGGAGGDPDGDDGADGAAGAVGADGQAGTAIANAGGAAPISGQLTTNGAAIYFNGPPTQPYDAPDGGVEVDWYRAGAAPTSATVDWQVVTNPKSPDFTGPTSGTLSFSTSSDYLGDLGVADIDVSAQPNLSGPQTQTFQIELTNPSTGSVLASTNVETLDVTNYAAVCFASGTRIRTARGDVAVEDLLVGDLAMTSGGVARPIQWLGHRRIDCRAHRHAVGVLPIRIAAHAFGPGAPSRDLLVSPGHAVCVDILGEVLIPAAALVDGVAVTQIDVAAVTYWHVELDTHDLLLAENLPCESYLEMGNRGFFAGDRVVALDAPPDAAARSHTDFCRPFHAAGPLVEAARARLCARFETSSRGVEDASTLRVA